MYFPSFGWREKGRENKREKVADCNKGIIVNSYKLPFSSSHFFFSRPNKYLESISIGIH
jgi:hypothetical protein